MMEINIHTQTYIYIYIYRQAILKKDLIDHC